MSLLRDEENGWRGGVRRKRGDLEQQEMGTPVVWLD